MELHAIWFLKLYACMNKTKYSTNLTTCEVSKFFLPFYGSANLFLSPYAKRIYYFVNKTMIRENNSDIEQLFITKLIFMSYYFSQQNVKIWQNIYYI